MKITDEKAQQELPMMLPEMERSCPHTSVNNWFPLALVNHLKPISSMTWAITKSDALDVVGFTKFFFFFPLFFVLFILFYFSVSFEYFFLNFIYLFMDLLFFCEKSCIVSILPPACWQRWWGGSPTTSLPLSQHQVLVALFLQFFVSFFASCSCTYPVLFFLHHHLPQGYSNVVR